MNFKNKDYPWGFIGLAIINISIILTAFLFEGYQGESYSPFTHFISELGEQQKSAWAIIFNSGMMIGGVFIVLFAYYLQQKVTTRLANIAAWIALVAALGVIGVGWFPANYLRPHMIAAFICFAGIGVSMFLYSWDFWQHNETFKAKILLLLSVIVFASFIYLAFAPKEVFKAMIAHPTTFNRPAFWDLTIVEWILFFGVNSWIIMVERNRIF